MTDVFTVRCTGYKMHERFFTIGKEYEVRNGVIVSDKGHRYLPDPMMTLDSDPSTWYLAGWYEFEIIEEAYIPTHFEISINDILG